MIYNRFSKPPVSAQQYKTAFDLPPHFLERFTWIPSALINKFFAVDLPDTPNNPLIRKSNQFCNSGRNAVWLHRVSKTISSV